MANIAISELETIAESLENSDLILVSKNNSGSYTSAQLTGEKLKNSIKSSITSSDLPSATSSSKGAVIVDSALSSTSTNPVQNKVVNDSIDISKISATATNLEEGDLFVISKVTRDESGTITSVQNSKLDATYIEKLIDKKVKVALNSITDLRETVSEITTEISSGEYTDIAYCTLDGNLGVLGTDIPNYNSITKWEIKFKNTCPTLDQMRGVHVGYNDTTFLYENNIVGTSNAAQFYNWQQFSNSVNTYKLVFFYDNFGPDNNSRVQRTLINTSKLHDGVALSGKVYYASSWDTRPTSETVFSADHIVTINKTTGFCDYDSVVPAAYSHGNYGLLTNDISGNVDHLLTSSAWNNGLFGKFYYIKGYNSNDEVVANLTPREKSSFVYLHDSVSNSDINFRGAGSAMKPVS